jgi:hypothetical protein
VLGDLFDGIPPGQRPAVVEALETLRAGFVAAAPAGDCCPPIALRRRSP